MHATVSIILLNYNGLRFNKDCIDSILEQSYSSYEIIFVDNASSDNSLAQVQQEYAHHIQGGIIKIIVNPYNDGFAQWNNIGVSHASQDSKYICLLNNDTIVDKDRLQELVTCIESRPELGAVWSLILDKWYEDQTKDIFFHQKKVGHNNYVMEPVFKNISQEEIDNNLIHTTWLGWCSVLYKKTLMTEPFPAFYFAYGEDTYLSFCILLQWYKLGICTTSIVQHFGSGSFGKKVSLLKAFHGAKNQLINIFLFHSTTNAIKLFPIYLLYQWVKIASGSRQTRLKGLYKGLVWCIKHRTQIQAQKKIVQSTQTISYRSFINQLSRTTFENTYFLQIPQYQIRTMKLLNKLCKVYFTLLSIK